MAAEEAAGGAKSDVERASFGILNVAAAVLIAGGASAEERALAEAVAAATVRDCASGAVVRGPLETEAIARAFNRSMDAVIEAVDDSGRGRTPRLRPERRAMVAADLDRAGFVLVERALLADLVVKALDMTVVSIMSAPLHAMRATDRQFLFGTPGSPAGGVIFPDGANVGGDVADHSYGSGCDEFALAAGGGDFMERGTAEPASDPNVND